MNVGVERVLWRTVVLGWGQVGGFGGCSTWRRPALIPREKFVGWGRMLGTQLSWEIIFSSDGTSGGRRVIFMSAIRHVLEDPCLDFWTAILVVCWLWSLMLVPYPCSVTIADTDLIECARQNKRDHGGGRQPRLSSLSSGKQRLSQALSRLPHHWSAWRLGSISMF